MERITKNNALVLFDTYGRVLDLKECKIDDLDDIGTKKGRNLSRNQYLFLENKRKKIEFDRKLGGYVHMAYVKNKLLFNEIGIERANISRLIYLSTFLDYNKNKEGMLVRYSQLREIIPLTKEEIFKLLKLSDRTFRAFIKDVKDCNLLYEVDKKFYLNTDYFNKGENSFNDKEYTRIYIKTTRELYENTSPINHKRLSYIFQLIPKLHYDTNILLHNPDVINIDIDNKMTLKDICEFLKVSHEGGNGRKFLKDLLKFNIKIDGITSYFFKYIIVEGGDGMSDYFVVNPQVIWSGNDMDVAKNILEKLFF